MSLSIEHGIVPTQSFVKANKRINAAVKVNGFVAVTGQPGMGKSFIKEMTLGQFKETRGRYEVIEFPAMARDREITGGIMSAMIRGLSAERARGDIIARTTQLTRILLDVSRTRRIILAIDEAHDLHPDTLYGLKKMHELGREGSSLFTILMFGQPKLLSMISPRELCQRISSYGVEELTEDEALEFLKLWGISIAGERAFQRFYDHSGKTPLSIKHSVAIMKTFMADGETKASEEVVIRSICGDLREKMKEAGISYSENIRYIEEKTGKRYDKSTVSKSLSGELITKTADDIRALSAQHVLEKQA